MPTHILQARSPSETQYQWGGVRDWTYAGRKRKITRPRTRVFLTQGRPEESEQADNLPFYSL